MVVQFECVDADEGSCAETEFWNWLELRANLGIVPSVSLLDGQ